MNEASRMLTLDGSSVTARSRKSAVTMISSIASSAATELVKTASKNAVKLRA